MKFSSKTPLAAELANLNFYEQAEEVFGGSILNDHGFPRTMYHCVWGEECERAIGYEDDFVGHSGFLRGGQGGDYLGGYGG